MKYLLRTTEVYRFSNEDEVEKFIAELKAEPSFELIKYSSEKRNQKAKGEIVDEWIRLTVVKGFNEEKEPCINYTINYERN